MSGSLLSHEAMLRSCTTLGRATGDEVARARKRVRAWHVPLRAVLGPASGPRQVFDRIAAPLAAELGYRVIGSGRDPHTDGDPAAVLEAEGTPVAVLLATAWGQDPSSIWRQAVRSGLGHGLRWCWCVNGPALRVIDADRAYAKRFAEFDLAMTLDDDAAFEVFWRLLCAARAGGDASTPLDLAVQISERHRADVRASLQHGVQAALTHLVRAFTMASPRRARHAVPVNESLIVIYRVLFLLFAEARGLVPRWHPIYRDSYTIESLRDPVERLSRPHGVWETLQAIARLAHRGCRAGALRVTPFNGRLFSPAAAPLADSLPLDDAEVRQALLALTTRAGRDRRERIAYADLGVEQLGGVYERLLDFEEEDTDAELKLRATRTGAPDAGLKLRATNTRRKATGTYYTPRSLTEYLVRRTLAPLTESASAEAILSLRIVDPSMGSGAFLVASCRYLATAYEHALLREGALMPGDVDHRDRASFRRTIAQRCLFGVDVNPMAVQLGRLSLWLATLAADKPLTFLDHHLRSGNSLLGASPADMIRQPPPLRGREARPGDLPLFPLDDLHDALASAVGPRLAIADEPGDTLEQVRAKERALSQLAGGDAAIARWQRAADLWCAGWFLDVRPSHRAYAAAMDAATHGTRSLPGHLVQPLLDQALAVAERERFFHWTLEFPEVFHSADAAPLVNPGFDAVVGNPPWEMLRADPSTRSGRAPSTSSGQGGQPTAPARLTGFARASGLYPLQGGGHGNLYQLFVERGLALLRRGGRMGLVLPSGFATDHGCAGLRRHVLERTAVDTFVTIENRDAIFPIHRGVKFLLLALTRGATTATVPCRSGIRSTDTLDRLPDRGADPLTVRIPQALIARLSGEQLAVPELKSEHDLQVAAQVAFGIPALGDTAGWSVHFGRELNATDDRPSFTEDARGLPVIEGKQLRPFAVDLDAARFRMLEETAAALLGPRRAYARARLGYREVAASTNRITLIAAVVPAFVVTTHTIFCLKEALDEDAQYFLCGMFNSFVANYLVRLRVGTHVTAAIIDRLPVPRPAPHSTAFRRIADLARQLARRHEPDPAAKLQAAAARLYGITDAGFAHVLTTFPLVSEAERAAALAAFRYIVN